MTIFIFGWTFSLSEKGATYKNSIYIYIYLKKHNKTNTIYKYRYKLNSFFRYCRFYLTCIHLFNIFCWLTLMTDRYLIWNAVLLRRKACMKYWHTFSFHPPVHVHLIHNLLYLHEILYTINIRTAVCVFERWELIARCIWELRKWSVRARDRENTSISVISPIPPSLTLS